MKRQLLLTCACVLALAMLGATSATAALPIQFHTESSPSYLYGQSTNMVFTYTSSPTNLEIKCSSVKLSGESFGTAVKAVSVHPELSGCNVGGSPAVVSVPAACQFRLGNLSTPTQAAFGITGCPATSPIVWKFIGCTWEISEVGNAIPSGLTFAAQGAGASRDLETSLALTGMTLKQSSGCIGGAGSSTRLSIRGSLTLGAYTNGAHTVQQGLWIE